MVIDINDYRKVDNVNERRIDSSRIKIGLIRPSEEDIETELAVDHTSEPIKKVEDIDRICDFLLKNKRYRDYMLFITGINFGLRVSDLRMLKFSDIIQVSSNGDMTFRPRLAVFERKTRNTRLKKKNRYISINKSVQYAVMTYLENTDSVSLNDYMFRNESKNRKSDNEPLSRKSIDRILKGIDEDLNLGIKMSTHTLRKTFAYHQMLMSGNDPRKLMLLSKMFGHSSVAITLDYIGVTDEEIAESYMNLNLGWRDNRYIDSTIGEEVVNTDVVMPA